ncbi:Clp protease N-terminal domain-containing protein [Rhodococcus ruber]|uniref:Clp protease N-terminal domain-containing protein n=1 Tax=Rhodococcus ruber TaxID=1830 RepID=UPI000E6B1849|nr:Clp protease N-terminal domain-containing protein [Rhodococcus ruber]AXY49243.1 ATP-binding protease [Rhodococcus ruber]
MFEKFTDHARRVVVRAADEARTRHHDHLRTAHLLLGLLREHDGVAAHALHALGLTAEDLTDRLGDHPGPPGAPTDPGPDPGPLPFTDHARHVLAQSLRQTALLGHDRIGTEHLLLALLDDTGTEPDQQRAWVLVCPASASVRAH